MGMKPRGPWVLPSQREVPLGVGTVNVTTSQVAVDTKRNIKINVIRRTKMTT